MTKPASRSRQANTLLRGPSVWYFIADQAVRVLANSPGIALAARTVADRLNEEFLRHPSTSDIVVSRREVEAVLSRDDRFESSETEWRLRDGLRIERCAPRLSSLRAGMTLSLHRWQRDALEAWRSAGKRGIVQAVTGAGKTRIGIAAITAHLELPSARAAVIVPTIELMEQWLSQLRMLLAVPIGSVGGGTRQSFSGHSVLVYVARSAADLLHRDVTMVDREHLLLIADECHRYGSDSYARAIRVPAGATLGLSATPEREHDTGIAEHVVPSIGPVIYCYDHERGVRESVISDFRILFVGVEFENVEDEKHSELTARIAKAHAGLLAEYSFLERATPFIGAVKALAARDDSPAARLYLSLTAERRRLLYGANRRNAFALWLAKHRCLDAKRTLIFHETIADCDLLALELTRLGVPTLAHHSGLGADSRGYALSRFARGEIRAVVAPRTLDEGIDVPEASLAIIVAGTRVKRQTIQRIGRVLRLSPQKASVRVVKVFVRGGADDPTLASTDQFSRTLVASKRAAVAYWPSDDESILAFLIDAPDEAR